MEPRSSPNEHHGDLPRVRSTTPGSANLHRLDHLQLPAHVKIWAHGGWHPGWLIACDHQPSGWYGLVQYRDKHHAETTEWLAAEQIVPEPPRKA